MADSLPRPCGGNKDDVPFAENMPIAVVQFMQVQSFRAAQGTDIVKYLVDHAVPGPDRGQGDVAERT
ncbi:hypothetical protein M2352_003975 [Azospirillum fermentarium]|uniref:hypothetical protein n=1 Tax=Azospirillum fermentarium TaxID=1233114 RepID=UPI002227C29A|nr:hypothetical protein [Azospirillum fermentarium]MCW2248341.1 hypothetical protein [Azospirillum fermentarium]